MTARTVLRNEGVRALFRLYGWRLVALVFAYYLVRDIMIYVVLPLVLFKVSR